MHDWSRDPTQRNPESTSVLPPAAIKAMALFVLFIALIVAFQSTAQAKILPLDRAYPSGLITGWNYPDGVAPLSAPYSKTLGTPPRSQVTFAYNTDNHNVLVGCRGTDVALIRWWTWTKGYGWGQTTCIGTEPWRVLRFRRPITPAIHLGFHVTFEGP